MSSQAETFCRDRRLYDVRRGVVYLRRTDDLAQRQWRHYGTVPAIKTHVIRDIGVTTRLSDFAASQDEASDNLLLENNVRDSASDARESITDTASVGGKRGLSGNKKFVCRTTVLEESGSARPQISLTEVTDRIPSASPGEAKQKNPRAESPEPNSVVASPPGDPNVSTAVSTPQGTTSTSWTDSGVLSLDPRETRSLPAFSHPMSTSKDLQHSLRESHALPEGHPMAAQFNTWGSRDWALESKLEPDPQPKSHAPKHYPPMSRAAGAGLGKKGVGRRQLRTLTDFRSRNGTVCIIRPLAPSTDIMNIPAPAAPEQAEDFDIDALAREKTYAMLQRIDRLLEPTRAFFTSDLASSEREVCSSTPSASDLTESLPACDEPHSERFERFRGQSDHFHGNNDFIHVHKDNFRRYFDLSYERDDQFHEHNHHHQVHEQLGHFHGQRQQQGRFRGQQDHFRTDDDPIYRRSSPFRGHSEPPRGRFDLSREHPQPARGQSQAFRGQNGRNVLAPADEKSSYYSHDSPSGHHKPRPLPPLQHHHPPSQRHGGKSSDPHSKLHSHRFNQPARKPRGGGYVGIGARGRGRVGQVSRSLREVVEELEKKGVDLHLKCEKWIAKCFSHHHHPAT